MPALTLSQLFGPNATLAGGTLTVKLSDFTGVSLNNPNPSPSEVAAAIVSFWKANKPSTSDTDPDIGLVCESTFKSFQQIGTTPLLIYAFTVSIRTEDTVGNNLDPDSVRG
jgi:hypothetical protein